MSYRSLTLAEVGEDALVAVIAGELQSQRTAEASGYGLSPGADPGPRLLLGIGDDAAVLDFNGPEGAAPAVVMSTDTMSQDQDFRLTWWADPEASGFDIGIKAAAQNLSDLNAMGAAPAALLVSLSLPGETTVEWVRQFYRGLKHAAEQPGGGDARIVGGDLGAAEKIAVSITAVGTVPRGCAPLRRGGARAGDQVALAGTLGRAAAGLAYLEASSAGELRPGPEDAALPQALLDECRAAQLRPAPPLRSGAAAVRAGATAGLDISDGLLRDAGRLERASGVRLAFDEEQLNLWAQILAPIAHALGEPERAREWVRAGGEDYALLATFPADAAVPEGFTRIGTVAPTAQEGELRGDQGQGWDSWRR